MADMFSKEKRHEIMSNIKSKDTKIEIKVCHWLYHHGIRYRKNSKTIIGTPDVSIKKYKIVIFVHGCFWHGHDDCKMFRMPKTRTDFWKSKIEKNKARDVKIVKELNNKGWNVFTIWECQLGKDFEVTMNNLLEQILVIKNNQNVTQ